MSDKRIANAERAYVRMLESLERYGNDPIAVAKRSAMRVIMNALREGK